MYRRVYSVPGFVTALRIFDALSVFFVAGVFVYGIAVLLYSGMYLYALKLSIMAAVPFVILSVLRVLIDSQRPYEVFDIQEFSELREKKKSGRSFPSRHVFSAFLIGVLWIPYALPFGIAAILLGVLMAAERVARGIHFIQDVLVGAVIGILSGVIGILIL
ncbi:MAG: phosphatase PAP2 family protein [Clostridia bacterium]|nr:phosphatase PAP2 family protein [Clostridia bacterium]